jgi:hypothetical protein
VSFAVVPPVCGQAPVAGCRGSVEPGAGVLDLRRGTTDAKNRLTWKWNKGAVTPRADFGDPTATTGYRLCIYDESAATPRLAFSAGAPAGGTCGNAPCWRSTGKGFTYKDKERSPDGLQQIVLKEGLVPGKAKIIVRGKGANLRLPALPLDQDPAVTVQLRSSDGTCWETRHGTPARQNDATRFRDRE